MDNAKIIHNNEPREVEIPAQRETFEAQVLVMTKAYKIMDYPLMTLSHSYPLEATRRVLAGKFRAELVMSSTANGKPTLIIEEEET